MKEPEGMEDTRRTKLSKSTKQSPYEFTETKADAQGLCGSAPDPLHICHGFQFNVFSGTPECVN